MYQKRVIYKRALMLAVPMMIQNGITNMVSQVDKIMVGSIGTDAMTAVSVVVQLIFVFNLAIFVSLSGPGIYAAQYYGQGDMEGFRNTFRIKHWICGACLLGGFLAFTLGGETLIRLYLHGESETIDAALTMTYGKQYLHIMLLGLLPFAVTQIYASSLRETGDSIKPMVAGILSVAVDIAGNWLLIYGNLGMPRLGVRGAAIATVAARVVEMCVVVIWALLRRKEHTFLQGVYRTMLVSRQVAAKIVCKGLPIFFNEFLWAGGLAALTQCYSTLGLEVVAGLNISNAICNLLNVVFVALGSAVGILIGQTLGASQYEKAKKDAFHLMWMTGFVCVGLAVILIALSGVFPQFYDTTEQVRHYGTWFIRITAVFFPVQGFLNALYFTLRSGGKTFVTFLFDSVYTWVIPLPVALILCRFSGLPIFAIYAIVQAADVIKVLVGYVMVKKDIWISNLVGENIGKESV